MTIAATWDAGLAWLAVALAVNTVASLFYYLRWIRAALRPAAEAPEPRAPHPHSGPARVAVLASTLSVLLGVAAGPVWVWLS